MRPKPSFRGLTLIYFEYPPGISSSGGVLIVRITGRVISRVTGLVRTCRALSVAAVCVSAPCLLPAQEPEPWWAGIEDEPPGVKVIEVDSLYPVSGSSVEALRREMDRRGYPEDGGRRDGYHLYRWRTHYRLDETLRGCSVRRFTILVRSVIVGPEWTGSGTASPALVAAWRRFVGNLRRHEEGHRSIVERAMRDYRRRASRITAEGCPELRDELTRLNGRIGERLAERQAAYDRRTRHGRAQGALWPPP